LTGSIDRQEYRATFDPEEVAPDDEGLDDDPLDPKPVRSGGEAPVQIGANIAELRRDARLRIDELAERAGISRSGLEQCEAGRNAPNVLAALKLVGSLGVSIDD
jgi:DNA-binding XRE family transcriptional regulator